MSISVLAATVGVMVAAYPALSVLSGVLVCSGMTRVDAMVPRLALDYPRAPRDVRGRGDERTREGARAGSGARVASGTQGGEQLPPPGPPRQYGGI
jgi:hypothetical protein